MYAALADGLVLFHLMFIVFAVLGAFLVIRWKWLIWLHVPASLWALYVEWSGKICPLTPLEISLRQKAGQSGYTGGFVEHYVLPIVYPESLTRDTQLVLGLIVLAINLLGYGYLWMKFSRRGKRLGV
jgi:hypothetical protein